MALKKEYNLSHRGDPGRKEPIMPTAKNRTGIRCRGAVVDECFIPKTTCYRKSVKLNKNSLGKKDIKK